MSTGMSICVLGTFTKPIWQVDHSLKLSPKVCSHNPWKTLTVIPCHHGQKKFMPIFSVNVRKDYKKSNVDDVIRSSGDYEPNQWDYSSVQSMNNNCTEENYGALVRVLKEEVRALFNVSDPFAQIKLIDSVEHLGLGYYFEDQIKTMLNDLMTSGYINLVQNDGLHATAVLFRLLRQHRLTTSEDIFKPFTKDEKNFKKSMGDDVEGLLSIYQASYLSIKGESILDAAKSFSATHLQWFTKSTFAEEIAYAMDLPSHWRPKRLETRRYIDIYEKKAEMKSTLLQFAKLDFNMVQNIHQKELTKVTNWWMSEGLAHKLKFARDRTFECFFVVSVIAFQPRFGYIREGLTKVVALMVILDDIYDIYGSLDELELFTHMVERWEIKELEKLPSYMRTIFKAIIDVVDENTCNIPKHNGLKIPPFLQKAAVSLPCFYPVQIYVTDSIGYSTTVGRFVQSILGGSKMAKQQGYTSLTEYMDNGWISVSGPLVLTHAFFFLTQEPTEEALELLESSPKIIRLASIIFRLCNDLATSTAEQDRGPAPTAIQCYMKEMIEFSI